MNRINKFFNGWNDPLPRVNVAPTPDYMAKCWDGLKAGGGVSKEPYLRLAGLAWKYTENLEAASGTVPNLPQLRLQRGAPRPCWCPKQGRGCLRGLTAFTLVARVHIEYPAVDLVGFWNLAGDGEAAALGKAALMLSDRTQFMGVFEGQTAASGDNFSVAARIAAQFFIEKGEAPNMQNFQGRWFRKALPPVARAWVIANLMVPRGKPSAVDVMTAGQAVQLAGALQACLASSNLMTTGGHEGGR